MKKIFLTLVLGVVAALGVSAGSADAAVCTSITQTGTPFRIFSPANTWALPGTGADAFSGCGYIKQVNIDDVLFSSDGLYTHHVTRTSGPYTLAQHIVGVSFPAIQWYCTDPDNHWYAHQLHFDVYFQDGTEGTGVLTVSAGTYDTCSR